MDKFWVSVVVSTWSQRGTENLNTVSTCSRKSQHGPENSEHIPKNSKHVSCPMTRGVNKAIATQCCPKQVQSDLRPLGTQSLPGDNQSRHLVTETTTNDPYSAKNMRLDNCNLRKTGQRQNHSNRNAEAHGPAQWKTNDATQKTKTEHPRSDVQERQTIRHTKHCPNTRFV